MKILDATLKKWKVPLPQKEWHPRKNTDDFGFEVKKILMAKEIDQRRLSPIKSAIANKPIWEGVTFLHTPRNIKALAPDLGISICDTGSFFYVRDSFLRLWDGSMKVARASEHIEQAIERTRSSRLYLDKTATTHTHNQLFNHWSGYSHRYAVGRDDERTALFPEVSSPFIYSYVDGGNVFTLTNQDEQVTVLIGEDHLYQTLQIFELEDQNWRGLAKEAQMEKSFGQMTEEIASKLSEEEVFHYCEEMFSQGTLLCSGRTGLIPPGVQLNLMLTKYFSTEKNHVLLHQRGWYRRLALESEAVGIFQIDPQKTKEARFAAAAYLAKLKIVHALIALDFNVPTENLHFISQANYHLDVFMAPAPHYALFLVNYSFGAEVIQTLLNSKLDLKLSESDIHLLEGYLETALKLHCELGDLLVQVETQLRAAGFTVIPVPAHFLFEPKGMYEQFPMPSEGICINFINGIAGFSSKQKKYYFITHGIHVGERVGALLMEAFSSSLKMYVPDMAVYFVGHHPENPLDFAEALDFWNRLETQSGIHCVTFPLQL